MKRRALTVSMAAGCVLAASGLYRVWAQDAPEAAAPPAFAPASPLHDVMEVNQEFFKELRKSMKPKPNFKDVAHAAHVIAEIGNVACYHKPTSEADWWRFGEGLKATALEIAKAADEKNEQALEEAVGKLGDSCKMCHDRYRQE
jgi:hypothetical protein